MFTHHHHLHHHHHHHLHFLKKNMPKGLTVDFLQHEDSFCIIEGFSDYRLQLHTRMKQLISSSSFLPTSSMLRKARISPYFFSLLLLILFVSVLHSQDFLGMIGWQLHLYPAHQAHVPTAVEEKKKNKRLPFDVGDDGQEVRGCDIFSGRWVWDDSTRPLYDESDCPYIPPQLTCRERGRPDQAYLYWRWHPLGCSLPSFNATLMLEALRGKRMMFVGDSLNRGQFTSMICLLHSVAPPNASSLHTSGSLSVFTAKEYNATVEFYWAPFLLESNSDDAIVHRISDRFVREGSINKHGKHWKGVDIMVFNTYLWWMTGLKMKILRGSFDDEVKDIYEASTEEAYMMGLQGMMEWVKMNMDLHRTRVFFVTMSPSHEKSVDWGGETGGNCYNQTTMITDPNYWGSDCRKSIMQVIRETFSEAGVPITVLNITQLSAYRRDAHTSIYKKQWSPLTPEQLANPVSYADCVHWCLPGLQDVWNELLFTKLFFPRL